MRRFFLSMLVGYLTSCGSSEPRHIRLDLVFRGSCGTSTRVYDTSCMAALEVSLWQETMDAEHEVASRCNATGGRYATLHNVVDAPELFPVLGPLLPRARTRVEIRGYHALSVDREVCDNHVSADLMLWGESEFVDLTDASVNVVTVHTECRPACDCEDFGMENPPTQCDFRTTPGACAAAPPVGCGQRKTGGGFCAACTDSRDCEEPYRCYRDTALESIESYCSLPCPPEKGGHICPRRMSCKRLDGEGFAEVGPR